MPRSKNQGHRWIEMRPADRREQANEYGQYGNRRAGIGQQRYRRVPRRQPFGHDSGPDDRGGQKQ
jgi:hypothetical protein